MRKQQRDEDDEEDAPDEDENKRQTIPGMESESFTT